MNAISFNIVDRMEVFIDLMNIESVMGRNKIDYVMLVRTLAKGRPISNVRAYDSLKDDDLEQKCLHNVLSEQKFRIIIPKVKCGKEGKQAGVDVQLASDVKECAIQSSCDLILIVSGDGDFVPVIDKVKAKGKKIEFASFTECANHDLIDATDHFTALDDLPIIFAEADL